MPIIQNRFLDNDGEKESILSMIEQELPHGSGFNNQWLMKLTTPTRVNAMGEYLCMNENGMYDGWTEHKAIITPSLINDFDIRITGRDRNQIKNYLIGIFDDTLRMDCEWHVDNTVTLIYS